MIIDPKELGNNLDELELVEKTTLRFVTQSLYDYRKNADQIFRLENDLVADIAEDVTREALESVGVSKVNQRLFGKIDYKRARYFFNSDFALRQALFVDSKAEKISGRGTVTLQTSQLSMTVKQVRSDSEITVEGKLPNVIHINNLKLLTTTIFVKYNYEIGKNSENILESISIACLPNGLLQAKYNPSFKDTIFIAGRNAPTRGEDFRVRLSFSRLKRKAKWRVQNIPVSSKKLVWNE
jgi:hypothetical protein